MTDKQITMIVAVAENGAIGKDNNLLWHISGDLKRFNKGVAVQGIRIKDVR